MKFQISKQQLLAQLPHKAGYDLIQALDEMPPMFVFDGVPIVEQQSAYPEIYAKLTPIERQIFLHLEKRGSITHKEIHSFCSYYHRDELDILSNVANCHIKKLRQKLPPQFVIITHRGYGRWSAAFPNSVTSPSPVQ